MGSRTIANRAITQRHHSMLTPNCVPTHFRAPAKEDLLEVILARVRQRKAEKEAMQVRVEAEMDEIMDNGVRPH